MTRAAIGAAARARYACAPLLALLTACGGGGGATSGASPSAGGTAPATPKATPTAIPVHVVANRSGKRFIEFSEIDKNNKTVYTGKADSQTAERDPSGSATSAFVNPQLRFVAKDGKVLYAASPAGTVTEQAKAVTVLMSGRVHAHTDDGTTLESDTLLYDDATQMVHAKGNVVLTTSNERLTGGTLDADLRFSHVHLTPGDS